MKHVLMQIGLAGTQVKCCLAVILAAFLSTAVADELPPSCLSPDNENPETVLRYVLDKPVGDSGRDRVHCMALPKNGYPLNPRFNPRRPNVFRNYGILSITDGKPYKGRETKRIRVEYDYVARLSERHPGGEITCKPWSEVIVAYHTEKGWVVAPPGAGDQIWKLQPLLAIDRKNLDEAYTLNHIGSVRELSTRIDTLSIAANRCPLPSKGNRK
jgi:hypothetical protein